MLLLRRMFLAALLALPLGAASAADKFIVVQSTTSTEQSGLFGICCRCSRTRPASRSRVVAVGTGQAIKNAQNGDGDVLFVHDKPDEEKFVADGYGVKRFDVMYNDFVIVGPKADPAGDQGHDVPWRPCARSPRPRRRSLARRRQRHAQGRAAALEGGRHRRQGRQRHLVPRDRLAAWGRPSTPRVGMNAYALTDRGTWLSFKNRGDLGILVEGDKQAVQPVRRHAGEPGQASRTSRPGTASSSSTG